MGRGSTPETRDDQAEEWRCLCIDRVLKTPAEMAAAGAACSKAPQMLRKPAVGVLCWAEHRASRRPTEATDVELDAERVAEVMVVAATDLDACLFIGDGRAASRAIQQIAGGAWRFVENAPKRRIQRSAWSFDHRHAGLGHGFSLSASAL